MTYFLTHGLTDAEKLELTTRLPRLVLQPLKLPPTAIINPAYGPSAPSAVRMKVQALNQYTLLPFITTCHGRTIISEDGDVVFAEIDADELQYVVVVGSSVDVFTDMGALVAFFAANEQAAETEREETAARWTERASEWQSVIDDEDSYVNHESGYERFNKMLANVLRVADAKTGIDIGCGTGDVARQIAKAGVRVEALDVSPGMIAKARAASHGTKIAYRVGTVADAQGPFDIIVSRGVVLSHLPKNDITDFLWHLTRLSREGSYVVFDFIQDIENGGFENKGNKNVLQAAWVRDAMQELGWVPVAYDGEDGKRVGIVAYHRPFPDSVYFVTGNPVKLLEMREASRYEHLHGCDFDLPELKHDSIEKIAEDKAIRAFRLILRPVICTDGGIFMDAYDGFPGPNSKQAAMKLKPEGLLRLLNGVENRNGQRINAVAFFDGKNLQVETKSVPVRFATEPRGTYPSYPMDKVLIPLVESNEAGLTYAEMPVEERGRATELGALAEFVRESAMKLG